MTVPGRWGTCGECPRDDDEMPYPEDCKNTDRQDHRLLSEQLPPFPTYRTSAVDYRVEA